MTRELVIISFLREVMSLKDVKNIDEIYRFFSELSKKDDFNTLYILNYLHKFICSDEVAKRKSSAREFEDLMAVLFNGIVSDNEIRKNINAEVPEYFKNAKDKIAGNKREKADILFKDFAISIKTLIPSNKEINMGSFEKSVLFDDLGLETFLTERRSRSSIGLGSVSQFNKLLNVIKTAGKLDAFYDKFKNMAKFIYSDDLLVAIKSNDLLELYFFNNIEISNIFKNYASDLSLTTLINRYEGNSLRINRDTLLKKCNKLVVLKFDRLNNSVMQLIDEFDITLHKSFGKYFNGDFSVKNEVCKELSILFNKFDERLKNA